VPAIKLKRKCSSGWTLSNNGTNSAGNTYSVFYYIWIFVCFIYCSISFSRNADSWRYAQVAIYINKLDYEIHFGGFDFSLLPLFFLSFSLSIFKWFSLFHQSKSSFVLDDKPGSSDSQHQWCVCVCVLQLFSWFSLVPADFEIEFHLIGKYPPCTTLIFFCLQLFIYFGVLREGKKRQTDLCAIQMSSAAYSLLHEENVTSHLILMSFSSFTARYSAPSFSLGPWTFGLVGHSWVRIYKTNTS
jgi:hypothetical protein